MVRGVLIGLGFSLTAGTVIASAFHNPYGKLPANSTPGDQMFAAYFRAETARLNANSLANFQSLEEWNQKKSLWRAQLFEMLGLDPLPPRTELKATVTGTLDQSEFTVEKLHFQSIPGLYVTGDLYVPKGLNKPAPTILYACGHALVKTNGVSYGCKVAYQHHGIWFARNGYVCLVLDTIQLGEIESIHHGTYREGRWWWNSRGYTPAGVEAWNCMRALDYLETRPEVDKTRFGVTGRSGGGAYSWWLAALDERIQAACPVAGMTDLENHVVDGTVEGHCDCMFMVNTYRWDYPQVAALVAPRPLLICNTDKDTIFPLDGVFRVYEQVRHVYDLNRASENLGLVITEGPHRDSQELQVPVFRWFNRFLKKESPLIEKAAAPCFSGQQLKVFETLPKDEITSKCDDTFSKVARETQGLDSPNLLAELRRKTFGGWPAVTSAPPFRALASGENRGIKLTVYELASQPEINLRLYVAQPRGLECKSLSMELLDESAWTNRLKLMFAGFGEVLKPEKDDFDADENKDENRERFEQWADGIVHQSQAWIGFAPRGIGLSRITLTEPYHTHVLRRFMLLGQTLSSMQAWDVRRAVQTARQIEGFGSVPLHLVTDSSLTEVATFAALFEPPISSLQLVNEPRTDKAASDFLNWSPILTSGQLLALAREKFPVDAPLRIASKRINV